MDLLQYVLVGLFVVSTLVGYVLIKNVPSLLHTPLMSGMNALSGITLIGALVALAYSFKDKHGVLAIIFGLLAVIAATINVVGGFGVTHRMLKMFKRKGDVNA